jgi:hypothetical protein
MTAEKILDSVYRATSGVKYHSEFSRTDFKIFLNYVKKRFVYNKDDNTSEVIKLIEKRNFLVDRGFIANQIQSLIHDVNRREYAKNETNK